MLTVQFTDNSDGGRVAKTVSGTETRYTLDPAAGLVQVLMEIAGSQSTAYPHPSASPFIPPRTSDHNREKPPCPFDHRGLLVRTLTPSRRLIVCLNATSLSQM
jgi:hypothetical protein